ncbi:MAG TPA: hypothetical protein PKO36_12090 [Candidatus Hydrogenedentes bacterium]|nr:hypothetical protein [Candidatus Hydrogenedentota bacterium]HOV75204.1 hypothetical protein [Candidatus Hydrogenedentota bacterium]
MSDISVQLVRDFFEVNAFHVMTYWQHDTTRARGLEPGLQLFVENTAPLQESARTGDFILRMGDVSSLPRAVVEVRAWHADRFYASVIEANPVLFEVAQEASLERARQIFGCVDVPSILVISELPASFEPRQRAIALLQQGGLSHVIEFATILQELVERINAYVSYSPSHTLQTLRLLKRYGLIRRQQMEFAFPLEAPVSPSPPLVETVEEPDPPVGDD